MAGLSREEKMLFGQAVNGTCSQAYLITSPGVAAADALASAFMQRLFCGTRTGCGACKGCAMFLGGSHPDLFRAKTKNGTYRIEEAREIRNFLSLRTYEGGARCVYIPSAERMNAGVQNALLKVLEESPADTVFLLTTSEPMMLLPTVRSRCTHVRMTAKSESEIRGELSDFPANGDLDAAVALCEGSPEEARRLISDARFADARSAAKEVFRTVLTKRSPSVFRLTGLLAPDFAGTVEMLAVLFRDLGMYSVSKDVKLYNPDMRDEIKIFSGNYSPACISEMADLVIAAAEDKTEAPQLNPKFRAEKLLFELLEVRNRCLAL